MKKNKLPLILGILLIFGLWLLVPVFVNETFVSTSAITTPQVAQAQTGGVVACGPGTSERECNLCLLYETGYNIIRLGFSLIGPIVVLVIIISGIFYITSAGYEERVGVAKKSLTGAVTGLVIIFISFAAVKALTTALGYSQDIFSAVDCTLFTGTEAGGTTVTKPAVVEYDVCKEYNFPNTVCALAAKRLPDGADGLVDPQTLSPIANKFVKPASGFGQRYAVLFIKNALDKLEGIMSNKGYILNNSSQSDKNWRVTEAYPPTSDHQNIRHFKGTAIDIAVYPRPAAGATTAPHYDILWQSLRDAGFSGTILNETGVTTAIMGQTKSYATTTGAHLHVQID